jgi:capsid protein
MRYAYFSAEWYGPAMSILDPVKETNASLMKIANGLSTYEKEAAQYGGDFKENIEQLARERRLMADLGIIPDNKYSTDMGGEKENEQKVLENQEQCG